MNPWVLAITGASGAVYGRELLRRLVEADQRVELVVSAAGQRVASQELGHGFDPDALRTFLGAGVERVRRHDPGDVGASIASGSYPVRGMAVCPCSMGSAGRIAAGLSGDLVERAADVQLKQRRPLVLVVRETPLSTLHLENLLRLSRSGAVVLPAAPGFYGRPASVADLVGFVVERTLDLLGAGGPREVRWGADP